MTLTTGILHTENKDWAENNHQWQIMKPKPTRMDTVC